MKSSENVHIGSSVLIIIGFGRAHIYMHAQHTKLCMHLFPLFKFSPESVILKKMGITSLGQFFWVVLGGGCFLHFFDSVQYFFQKMAFFYFQNFKKCSFIIFRRPGGTI